MGPRRRFGMLGAPGIAFVGESAEGTKGPRLPPPKFKPSLYSTGVPPKNIPWSSHEETYMRLVRGLNEGEYQFEPPWTAGYVGMPGGWGVWIGLPLASKPLIQFTFTNGFPRRNFPVARSRT